MTTDVVQHLDMLATRMAEAVDGENAVCVSAAAIAVALDAAEELKEVAHLQAIHQHTLHLSEEIAKLISAKTS